MTPEYLNFTADRDAIGKRVEAYRAQGKRMVFTNGCFDLIHVGHTRYLKKARSLGDILLVGLNSDLSIKKIKDQFRPIIPEDERAEVLLEMKFVDMVILFDTETPYDLINFVKPHILVKGGDWKPEDIIGSDVVLNSGGTVKSIAYEHGHSTTEIIKRITEAIKPGID